MMPPPPRKTYGLSAARFCFLLIALFLLNAAIPVAAFATDYYVATTGSDAAAGTAAAPWRTIAHAVNQMQAGDTTYVRGGTYNEGMIWFRKSGTASAPIRLLNAPGESPVIDCIDADNKNHMVLLQNAAGYKNPIGWITIEGFEIRDCLVGIKMYNGHDIVIRRNWIHHNHSQGTLGNGKNVLVDRNVINHNGAFASCAAGGLDWSGTSTVCNKDHGMYNTGTNWTITNNLIYDNLAIGISVAGYPYANQAYGAADPSFSGASNWLIANNTIAYNGYGSGINLWQPGTINNKIINNILYENGQKTSTNGVFFTGGGGGHIIQNNLCYATAPGGTACIGGSAAGKYTASGNIINTVAPGFVNAPATIGGTPDFHLQASSPAIDKGQNLSQVTWDHDGGARPWPTGGQYDIGAYEYGSPPDSGSPPPNPTGGAGGTTGGGLPTGGVIIDAKDSLCNPVDAPVKLDITVTGPGDHDNGHGNDDDHSDDSNPGGGSTP